MEFNLCRLAHEYLIYLATCQCLVTQNIFFTLVPTYYVGKVCAVQKNLTLKNSKTGDTRISLELFRLASATTRILFSEIVPFSVKVRIEKYHVPTRPRFFETAAIPPTFIRRKKHEQDQFSVFPSLPATGHVYVLCTVCLPSQSAKARPPLLLPLLSVPSFHFPGALLPPLPSPPPRSISRSPPSRGKGDGRRRGGTTTTSPLPPSSSTSSPVPRPLGPMLAGGRRPGFRKLSLMKNPPAV